MSQARCIRRFLDACERALEPKSMSLLSSSLDDMAFTAGALEGADLGGFVIESGLRQSQGAI